MCNKKSSSRLVFYFLVTLIEEIQQNSLNLLDVSFCTPDITTHTCMTHSRVPNGHQILCMNIKGVGVAWSKALCTLLKIYDRHERRLTLRLVTWLDLRFSCSSNTEKRVGLLSLNLLGVDFPQSSEFRIGEGVFQQGGWVINAFLFSLMW